MASLGCDVVSPLVAGLRTDTLIVGWRSTWGASDTNLWPMNCGCDDDCFLCRYTGGSSIACREPAEGRQPWAHAPQHHRPPLLLLYDTFHRQSRHQHPTAKETHSPLL